MLVAWMCLFCENLSNYDQYSFLCVYYNFTERVYTEKKMPCPGQGIFSEVNTDYKLSLIMKHWPLLWKLRKCRMGLGAVCEILLHKEWHCLGLDKVFGYQYPEKGGRTVYMEEALETRLITSQLCVWLTQPIILFQPPLIEHLTVCLGTVILCVKILDPHHSPGEVGTIITQIYG